MCLQKLWWNQHQKISINICIRRYVSIRRSNNMCYTLKLPDHTLKPDDQNLRIKYSDSDQDPYQVISTQKRQHKLKQRTFWLSLAEHSEALLSIQDRLITNGFIQDKIFSKRKEHYYHWKSFMDNNVSLPWLYKQVSVRKEMANNLRTHIHAYENARSHIIC